MTPDEGAAPTAAVGADSGPGDASAISGAGRALHATSNRRFQSERQTRATGADIMIIRSIMKRNEAGGWMAFITKRETRK